MYFQELIFTLQRYWGERGCLLAQPYDVEVGAGTMSPSTFLRALGPEPWNVAYVQPCRRPADGRYGENPNRLYQHHQFQVVLKPAPKNSQQLYLDSIAAIGIDPLRHDIRFVEDNWESPTLGAWGLGWEVWCDGMEITQFTYFQQCGGFECRPVVTELTYGLERLAMFIQDVDDVYSVQWVEGVTYGDVFRANEREMSRHAFELADTDALLQWFAGCEAEAGRLLEAGAVLPAYDHALKCSHLFNLLDARGAISVTERAAYMKRVRDTTRDCARAYVDSRSDAGWPLLQRAWTVGEQAAPLEGAHASAWWSDYSTKRSRTT